MEIQLANIFHAHIGNEIHPRSPWKKGPPSQHDHGTCPVRMAEKGIACTGKADEKSDYYGS